MSKKVKKVDARTVTFEEGEFEENFPEAAGREDLNKSDQVRAALGLAPRKKSPGRPIVNNSELAVYNRQKQREYRKKE